MKKKSKSERLIPKKKQRKLLTIIPICIILLVMLVFLMGYIIGVSTNKQPNLEKLPVTPNENITNNDTPNNNENNEQDDDNDKIELPKEIYFLQDKNGQKIISNELDKNLKYLGKYTCEYVGCGNFQYVPSPTEEQHFFGNDLVLISEWSGEDYKGVLYNYQTNKVVETYNEVLCSYSFSNNKYSVLVTKNDKMGILSNNGKIVYDLTLDSYKYNQDVCYKYTIYEQEREERYPGYNGQEGVFSKDNKYGVVNLENGDLVIDFKYEGLRLMYDGNYSIKENDKWYLVNNKLEKIIKNGYDEIHSFNNVILVGNNIDEKDISYKLIDTKGADLTNSVNVSLLDINQYRKVTANSISLGTFGGGTFTYDLSKKQLKYKYGE